jgi:uncharacterized protein (TIGR02099 family)
VSIQPRPDPSSPAGDDGGRHPSLAAELSATAHRVEHAVEETIEHGIEVAEQTIVRRFGVGALRVVRQSVKVAFWALVAAYFAFGALLLATRYVVLPRIDHWRPQIQEIASRALRGQVTIGRIEAGWRGVNPHLALTDVRVTGPRGGAPLELPRVEATASWLSLLAFEPRFVALRARSPHVSVVRLGDGSFTVAGFAIEPGGGRSESSPALDWLLAQRRLVVRDAQVDYRDERHADPLRLELDEVNLIVQQSLGSHSFALQAVPTAALAGPLDVRGRFSTGAFARPSDLRQWSGEAFAQLDFVDLGQLARFAELPVAIEHAQGALRAWLGFDGGEITRTTADVALLDVGARLAPDLEPLRLASLQGRFTQRRWGDLWPVGRGGQELALAGTTFRTADGLTFPPLDLRVRRTRAAGDEPQLTELEASRVDLESLATVIGHLPLPRDVRDGVARYAVRGVISGFSLAWSGEMPRAADLVLRSRFSGLASAAQPAPEGGAHAFGVPGFDNLSGSVRIDRGSGTLELTSADATLVLPGVFAEPRLPLKLLVGTVHWKQAGALELRVEGLRAANDDAEVTANGTWRATDAGPGAIDLSGRILRGNVQAVHRYMPLAASDGVRRWLEHALVRGRVLDGTYRLRGELARFPFRDPAQGEFRIAGRVTGGVLDVFPAPAGADGKPARPGAVWPLLSDIDAEVVFERVAMTIGAQRGRALGARIERASARIDDLANDATLQVRGQASGPLAELLRYANESPVKGWIGGVTEGVEAQGSARLDLTLQIPLRHAADSKVAGALVLQNNALTLAGIPPLARVTGSVNFHERGVRIENLAANALGGTLRLDASTRADGALVFSANGSATPAGLRSAVALPPVQRLLDRCAGSARYQASIAVKDGVDLRIDSDLAGLAVDGVAPLRKAAADTLPLRIERRASDRGDDLHVQAGRVLGVRIERRAERDGGTLRLARGVIAMNEPANLPERGLLLIAAAPRLDLDAWLALLAADGAPARGARAPASSSEDLQIDLIALRTQELVIYGHRLHNLTLGASRLTDGGYGANVVSDGATGYVAWRPGADPQAPGHVTAQLARLVIPSNKEKEVVEALRAPPRQMPSLQATIDQFELSGMKLGRLELAAHNVGSGGAAAWRVQRLDIVNPDMRLSASGEWAPAAAGTGRRTQLAFGLDAFDAGATLGRLGFPGALSGGAGRVEGDANWFGSPLDIDYATLSGRVRLTLDQGRFLKAEAGNAARLLGLLSLQSLGRNLVDGGRQFTEGFAFASMRADATIERGILRTDNFRMNGASAAVLMSGSLDLRNETQQLTVVVLPEIDASTAALALGVANPVLGLGTYLAQLVLKDPLSKVFAMQYDVSGTWSEPKVTRSSRIQPSPAQETAR